MRKMIKYLVMVAALVVIAMSTSGCMRREYLMFEDGDFDGIEFSDYDLMHNAELEMDDVDRE